MNALATDQALRIAGLIHGNPKLRGVIRAGLYIGDDRKKGAGRASGKAGGKAAGGGTRRGVKSSSGELQMTATSIITDRVAMHDNPPDILLTNYKMLDYLLLRPRDQRIWQHNARGVLRYLVVDDIHTFDGAQGTDLACLIRRLKRRLQADDGALCCVGTSATLGGPSAKTALLRYATQVFGEPFDATAVVGEQRLSITEFLASTAQHHQGQPELADAARLDPGRAASPEAWLSEQLHLWFDESVAGVTAPDGPSSGQPHPFDPVALGAALRGHATFRALLGALESHSPSGTVALGELVKILSRDRSAWRRDPGFGRLALTSLIGLVSAAKTWRPELAEVAAAREEAGEPRPSDRLVDVRLQLWQREMRRMVAPVTPTPRLRHSDDLDSEQRRAHLPVVHCRDCGAMGWATRIDKDKPEVYRIELSRFYRSFFGRDPQVRFLFPAAGRAASTLGARSVRRTLEQATLLAVSLDSGGPDSGGPNSGGPNSGGPDSGGDEPTIEVDVMANIRTVDGEARLKRDCPFCAARESLSLVGFRAATLTSVFIDQLFASPFNDHKKLLTFSDSVQDAAHRAGFFGARTWRTNLRLAMMRLIVDHEDLPLDELAAVLIDRWGAEADLHTWVATSLAPNMAWLHDWDTLKRTERLPVDSDLVRLISTRLAYEITDEFSLKAGIGRSLPRTAMATMRLDDQALDAAMTALLEPLRNEVPGLGGLPTARLRRCLVGLLHYLRRRGGILASTLPRRYVETCGKDLYVFKQAKALPAYGRTSRLPALLTDRAGTAAFDTWRSGGWYANWLQRSLTPDAALGPDPSFAMPPILAALTQHGLLRTQMGKKGEQIWGLREGALRLTQRVRTAVCERCHHRLAVAAAETEDWQLMPCLNATCAGRYRVETAQHAAVDSADSMDAGYFGRLYRDGDLQRIFAEEHTGLLTRDERETVERQFKARGGLAAEALPADDPRRRKPWYPNLLSCTPTLEMGIDIGDLSTVMLCSVPPAQANYLQRIGRAGRRDGNALVLTIAAARPHDQYFFAQPDVTMDGDVQPPGVFLDAAAVLERQLTAFCFDRWVADPKAEAEIPPRLRRFPHTFGHFVSAAGPTLLREFEEMFEGQISASTIAHLRRFLLGDADAETAADQAPGDRQPDNGMVWNLHARLHQEKRERDSIRSKASALTKELRLHHAKEARSQQWEQRLDDLEAEKQALQQLASAMGNRQTIAFLTDQGLLPNCAFPEAPVRLTSVIWRRKKKVPKSGKRYDTWSYDYARSPSSALSELAPGSDFYAGGRKVRIDQVDVTTADVEEWRFCDDCHHAERTLLGNEATACPACNSGNWCDEGQLCRMLRMGQVFAGAPDRESRIRDDQDDRTPRFFQRQMLVDLKDSDRLGAWKIDDAELPFGFEFLSRASFREVNFGELSDQGNKSLIAGREGARRGFQLCGKCGKVQRPNHDPIHTLSCPAGKPDAPDAMEDCLFLYHEFASEALRILLPMADLGTHRQLNSFMAALQIGLRARFGGDVTHLQTTLYSEPDAESSLRRQYLVLFDAVPGGTGYLKQLVTPTSEGGRLPLFDAFELAKARIESCACWHDTERDGCYRCLFGYRNASDQGDTSATTASELLGKLLAAEPKLSVIDALSQVSIKGLMDSVLEARFIEALRQIRWAGKRAKVVGILNHKPGHLFSCGEAQWEIEAQVDLGRADGVCIDVSVDFVMRPASATSTQLPIAVFLDGWAYHHDRVDLDLRQRMALMASGKWDVWSFTRADIDAKLRDHGCDVLELALPKRAAFRAWMNKLKQPANSDLAEHATFALFERELLGQGPDWHKVAKAALVSRSRAGTPADAANWASFVRTAAPPCAAAWATAEAKLVSHDACETSPYVELMTVHDGQHSRLLCTLDDSAEQDDAAGYKAAWQGFLRLFQLLRFTEHAWFMTRQGRLERPEAYDAIAAVRAGAANAAGGDVQTGDAARWLAFAEIEPQFQATARLLMAAGVAEPEVGLEIPNRRDRVWAEAELTWEDARVALTSHARVAQAVGPPHPGWSVFYVDDLSDDVSALVTEIHAQEETP